MPTYNVKLSAGNMVITLLESVELFDRPPRPNNWTELIATAKLKNGQTAIVIALDSSDGRSVYVVGPTGTGWTYGAFLKRIEV